MATLQPSALSDILGVRACIAITSQGSCSTLAAGSFADKAL
ncbi:hypothetical protein [Dendronalium phyllosphericum]|nr:hypothetical protein [Dendronalium phyllosphericum]